MLASNGIWICNGPSLQYTSVGLTFLDFQGMMPAVWQGLSVSSDAEEVM